MFVALKAWKATRASLLTSQHLNQTALSETTPAVASFLRSNHLSPTETRMFIETTAVGFTDGKVCVSACCDILTGLNESKGLFERLGSS